MAVITPNDFTKPATTGSGSEVVPQLRDIALTSAQVANGNYIKALILPAGHRLLDLLIESTDLDTNVSPTITLDVGIFNATEDGLVAGTTMVSAATTAQTGGVVRLATASLRTIGVDKTADRVVAIKINTPATAAAGNILAQALSVAV